MAKLADLILAVNEGNFHNVAALLFADPSLIYKRDDSGATALHYAALNGNRPIAELLLQKGADINCRDFEFGATPAGWAIEYLRERNGFLAIELEDFAHAIKKGDVHWTRRFLERFPHLRDANDRNGQPFRKLAKEAGEEIESLFI